MTMDEISRQLRDADPVPREAGLSNEQKAAMRRAILAAVPAARTAAISFWKNLSMAAALTVIVAIGVMSVHRGDTVRAGEQMPPPPASGSSGSGRTQVQFSTPGGTRIIWTLDPNFQMREARR
jgi:hypothetical protein